MKTKIKGKQVTEKWVNLSTTITQSDKPVLSQCIIIRCTKKKTKIKELTSKLISNHKKSC